MYQAFYLYHVPIENVDRFLRIIGEASEIYLRYGAGESMTMLVTDGQAKYGCRGLSDLLQASPEEKLFVGIDSFRDLDEFRLLMARIDADPRIVELYNEIQQVIDVGKIARWEAEGGAIAPSPRPVAGHLYRIILPVPAIEAATRFYSALLGSAGQRVSPGRHYFDCGGTILACYDPIADGDGEQGEWRFHPLQYHYIAAPDLEAALESAMAAGAVIERPIETMPWGERLFYCRDPFGSGLCFVDSATKFTGA
jgi:uncharacterized glyoxalase superfamily protein PhnB